MAKKIKSIFSFGQSKQEAKETKEDGEPIWGQGLTKPRVQELNEEMKKQIAIENVDAAKYFDRPLDNFNSPLEYYSDITEMAEGDSQSSNVDILDKLATKLGDDHPLIVALKGKMKRNKAFAIAMQIDDRIKKNFGDDEAKIETVFAKKPKEFDTPVDYYSEIIKSHGVDAIPSIKEQLGDNHPVVKALTGQSQWKPNWDVLVDGDVEKESPAKAQTTSENEPATSKVNETPEEDSENKAANVKKTPAEGTVAPADKGVTRDETADVGGPCNCSCLGAGKST